MDGQYVLLLFCFQLCEGILKILFVAIEIMEARYSKADSEKSITLGNKIFKERQHMFTKFKFNRKRRDMPWKKMGQW